MRNVSFLNEVDAVEKRILHNYQNLLQTLIYIFISIRFFFESERGIFPQTEFVFDLELPIDFKPENNDGEVDEFTLVKAADVSTIDILPPY